MFKWLALIITTLFLSACYGFFDKDNTPEPTPLTQFSSEVNARKLWSSKIGSGSSDYLKLNPTLEGCALYTASAAGVITATNKYNGHAIWCIHTGLPITSGPGAGSGIVVAASRHGEIIALEQSNGHIRWKKCIDGEVLANPAIRDNVVVIKSVDGALRGLSAIDGHELWTYQEIEPSLILRGSSAPMLSNNSVFAGFANGNLAKLNLESGQLNWMRTIAIPEGAFSIQRMVDIDADPLVYNHSVFAATYQGKIASLDWNSGQTLWSRDISSYTGMTADNHAVYISDAKSHIWSFGTHNGLVNWRQLQLEARNVTAPATICNYIVLGDAEGYLHFLSKSDGHFAGREFAGNTIMATPIVENNVVYVLTTNGSLVAYTLS